MAEVVLDCVSRDFANDTRCLAVDGIDLTVHAGEFLVLLGPSGCGKSTTLRMIAGLEEVSSGEIRIRGKRINETTPRDRDIALVFQNDALYPHFSVRRNLAFGLELRFGGGWFERLLRRIFRPGKAKELESKRTTIPDQVAWAAGMLGIERLLDRLPGQLSGGERQRVALGRALVRKPSVLLLDEPLSHLDAQLRFEMRCELKALHERLETTLIYVTHDQVEALALGQRIAIMRAGRIEQVGTSREVYERPVNQFVAGFLGSPPMNFIEGRWSPSEEGGVFRDGSGRLELAVRSPKDLEAKRPEQVVLGIRPEDVRVEEEGRFWAVVRAVERLGDVRLLQLALDEKASRSALVKVKVKERTNKECGLLCKMGLRDQEVAVGDRLRIGFASSRIHWFEADSGMRLQEK